MSKIFKEYVKEFFGNKFVIRLMIWAVGFVIFVFGLAALLSAQIGFSTYDTLLQPIRILFGVSDPTKYGTYILIPAGVIFSAIAIVLHYIQFKKIKIEYFLAMIPAAFAGVFLDLVLKIPFFDDQLTKNIVLDYPFIDNPISWVFMLVSAPLFAISIGLMTASNIMPNNYAILVHESSVLAKKSFHFTQYIFDATFILAGFVITVINIYTNRADGDGTISWPSALHYIGFGTLVILITQGYLINKTIIHSKRIFKFN